MKVYKWEGNGFYLGATIIVVSESLESAAAIIEKTLRAAGLEKSYEETERIKDFEIREGELVYFDNGDY